MNGMAYTSLLSIAIAALASSRLAAQGDTAPVDTTRWVLMNRSSVRSDYIDARTMRLAGDTVTVWMMTRLAVPFSYRGDQITEILTRISFDCARNQSRNIQEVYYAGDSANFPIPESLIAGGEWSGEVPGSIGESVAQLACGLVSPHTPPRQ